MKKKENGKNNTILCKLNKTKAMSAVYAVAAVLLLSGCGAKTMQTPAEDIGVEIVETTPADQNQIEEDKDTAGERSSKEKSVLLTAGDSREIFLVKEGEAPKLYTLPDTGERYSITNLICEDGNLYYQLVEKIEGSEEYETGFYRFSEKEGKPVKLLTLPNSKGYYDLDLVKDGVLHILACTWDDSSERNVYQQLEAAPDSQGVYTEQVVENALSEQANGEDRELLYGPRPFGDYGQLTPEIMLEQGDYFMLQNTAASGYALYDRSGDLLIENWLSAGAGIPVFSDDGLAYVMTDEAEEKTEGQTGRILFREAPDGEDRVICELERNENGFVLALQDKKVYYAITCEKSYEVYGNKIFCYDLGSGETSLIYQKDHQAGRSRGEMPDNSRVHILGNTMYMLTDCGMAGGWCSMNLSDEEPEPVLISPEVVTARYDYEEICDVTYESISQKCERCGKTAKNIYIETVHVKDIVPGAEAINADQDAGLEELLNSSRESEESIAEEHDALHEEYWQSGSSVDREFAGIDTVGDKYLQVAYEGYEYYAGAAHGMPWHEYCFYDLVSGAKLRFSDIYTGSPDDFKKAVAAHTVENYNSFEEDYNPYFPTDPETLREDAYEYANLDMLLSFTESGVRVEYSPYEFGPYASGFIEFEIPYDELGIEIYE